MQEKDYLEIAKNCVHLARDKKATRLSLQDLRGFSDVCEYALVCSGSNDRQTRAIAESIITGTKQEFGIKPVVVEGQQSGHWILLDYGALIVHIFFDYVRDYYAIEKLWPEAKAVDIRSDVS